MKNFDDPTEVEALRLRVALLESALAYEARVAEAHYSGFKTYPKSRRPYAEEQVKRMRELALGGHPLHYMLEGRSVERERRNLLEGHR